MGSVVRKPARRPNPERYRAGSQRGPHQGGNNFVNARPSDATIATVTLTLQFDQNVMLDGIPQITTDVGGAPTSATQTADDTVDLVYLADQAAATVINIPRNDPAIRTLTGGWVEGNVFPVPV